MQSNKEDSVKRNLETKIGRALIAGEVEDGAKIVVDVDGDELAVRAEKGVSA